MQLTGINLLPIDQITGGAYVALCDRQIPSIWAHPSNFQHIATAEAFAAAEMLAHLDNSNIVCATRLMGAIPLAGITASALDPLTIINSCLEELGAACPDGNVCASGFSEIVVKEVFGEGDDGKTGVYIADVIAGEKRTFFEWREIADTAEKIGEGEPALSPGQYVVPHLHLLIAVLGHDGRWWSEAKIRQRLAETVRRERQASLPKKLGGRRRGGYATTRGHIMACVEYSIKRFNQMNDDELLLTTLWRAICPNSGFLNVVLIPDGPRSAALVDFLAQRQASLRRTLIDKNHRGEVGTVSKIMSFLNTCPRLVSVNITSLESELKPDTPAGFGTLKLIKTSAKLLLRTASNWFRKCWPPWTG